MIKGKRIKGQITTYKILHRNERSSNKNPTENRVRVLSDETEYVRLNQ
jgi:hypothetical protein